MWYTVKSALLAAVQSKLLLKDVSVDSHDLKSENVSYKQYCLWL